MASTPPASPQPPKDKSVTLMLELLPGVLGFLGFNWIYNNQTATGLFWLIGYLVWRVIAVTIFFLTGGLGYFGTMPINMTLIALSATQLNNHILIIVLSLLSRPASRCPMRQSHFPLPDFFSGSPRIYLTGLALPQNLPPNLSSLASYPYNILRLIYCNRILPAKHRCLFTKSPLTPLKRRLYSTRFVGRLSPC